MSKELYDITAVAISPKIGGGATKAICEIIPVTSTRVYTPCEEFKVAVRNSSSDVQAIFEDVYRFEINATRSIASNK